MKARLTVDLEFDYDELQESVKSGVLCADSDAVDFVADGIRFQLAQLVAEKELLNYLVTVIEPSQLGNVPLGYKKVITDATKSCEACAFGRDLNKCPTYVDENGVRRHECSRGTIELNTGRSPNKGLTYVFEEVQYEEVVTIE
jgi:hypothetical protein